MSKTPGKMKLAMAAGLVLVVFASTGCTPAVSFGRQLDAVVAPYRFSVAGWQSRVIMNQAVQWLSGEPPVTDGSVRTVQEYFALVNGVRTGRGAQICFSNPEVVALAVKAARNHFDNNPAQLMFRCR